MTPHITAVRMTGARNRADLPLLVLGPALGTSATTLWSRCAEHLADSFDLLAWDLPGHGHSRSAADSFTMAELAAGVLRVVDDVLAERGETGGRFYYAGNSVGGAAGLQLLLDQPRRVASAAVLCTGARIGDEAMWRERIEKVGASGTPVMLTSSAERWFTLGFLDRSPTVGSALLHALQETEADGYVQVCAALAAFDVRDRLAEIGVPVLAVAGRDDVTTPPDLLRAIADGVQDGRFVQLDDVAHLAPAEAPEEVALLLRQHFLGDQPREDRDDRTVRQVREAGMQVRREVLGDAHVDRATAGAGDLTREFQEFITEYAWGGIWTRPGLDRRSRSLITLTALIARGHHEELALHLRAARTNGVGLEEIKELILQTAVYCGVPAANTALRIAEETLRIGPDEA